MEDNFPGSGGTPMFGGGGRVMARDSFGNDRLDTSAANRAWGMSIGAGFGPLSIRAAHQNRHVARVRLYDAAGNNMEAMNSLVAANLNLGWATVYAAYSVNRGWGSTPLFNPENPYGAGASTIPSTNSRDVLVGMAVPLSHSTTFLASVMHKNDRGLMHRDANMLAIGASYVVSRHTDFYASWSHMRNTSGPGYSLGISSGTGATNSALNIGMRHSF